MPRDWTSGGSYVPQDRSTTDIDREEARTARRDPLRQHDPDLAPHPPSCRCLDCCIEGAS